MTLDYGLGRLASSDPKDRLFPMAAVLPETSPRTSRFWYANGGWLNQGSTPRCVAFSLMHWLLDGPVVDRNPGITTDTLYHEAQRNDEWPGEDYDGTSVRAGAKVLQGAGLISEYRWAAGIDDVVVALLEKGPVVVGTNWYNDMFNPDGKTGVVTVSGGIAGGHAFKLDGINRKTGLIRIKNSWGRDWGKKGFAYIAIGDVEKLLKEDGGEAMLATELKPAK